MAQVRSGGRARQIGEKAWDGDFYWQVAIFLTKPNQTFSMCDDDNDNSDDDDNDNGDDDDDDDDDDGEDNDDNDEQVGDLVWPGTGDDGGDYWW